MESLGRKGERARRGKTTQKPQIRCSEWETCEEGVAWRRHVGPTHGYGGAWDTLVMEVGGGG